MKKYISADLRVINISANDIIATSISAQSVDEFHENDATLVGGRRGWDEF